MKIISMKQEGITLVELMVALAIGSFLMIGAIQIYNQSRQAFVINESIARVQETAQFAMDTIEADLRMASNWGRNSRGLAVEGRSIIGDDNPNGLPLPATNCAADWALNLALPIDGSNNAYGLACATTGGSQANSDVVTIRRASVAPVAPEAGRLQIQTTRIQGQLFADGAVPPGFVAADSATHNLIVTSYYVSPTSTLINGVPTLRRHRLIGGAAGPTIVDEEVAPGIENLQIQLGVDVDADNTVDRYVNPGDPIYNPNAAGAGFVPGARIMTARIWMIVRGIDIEPGVQDGRNYQPGDVALGVPNDTFRRMQVSKTILLRNART
ncbi:MAG: PilW family protein [Gammaproteobacteria bacterium]|jgi:type IV pilus assembly protein PilW|nr:PilW family protein [Gammaproteobacteria bacterium]MDH5241605.1 PilW family protein [Gammaproteobacteria bacterium]MDH5261283.1 PilW family protein [Gammaproteobacteria bacterium]MDH5583219.1 PilW family protein [Gammaproteobacteria bacterium]